MPYRRTRKKKKEETQIDMLEAHLEWGRPERGMRVEEVPARGAARGASRSGLRGALMELLRVGALAGADIMRAILGGPSVCSMKVPLLDGCGLLLLPGLLLPARDLLGLSIRIACLSTR